MPSSHERNRLVLVSHAITAAAKRKDWHGRQTAVAPMRGLREHIPLPNSLREHRDKPEEATNACGANANDEVDGD